MISLPPFAVKVISKLRRFQSCAEDGQDADIGRDWFDLLTQLGLLNRIQRSPALWQMTQQGEDVLRVARDRQPVKVLGYSVVGNRYAIAATKGEILELHEGYADHMIELVDHKHVTRLQAELAELQATIAQLREHNGGVTHWANPEYSETITAELKAHNMSMGGAPAAAVARYTIALAPIIQSPADQNTPFPGYPQVPEDRKLNPPESGASE